jgi:hypothetical protein
MRVGSLNSSRVEPLGTHFDIAVFFEGTEALFVDCVSA